MKLLDKLGDPHNPKYNDNKEGIFFSIVKAQKDLESVFLLK